MTTPTELMILSWLARLTSIMSFIGSSSMIYMILSDRERKLTKSNHRMMLGLSISDCLQSAAYAMTTIAIPPTDVNIYGALGNSATCTVQGFFLLLGVGVPLYNASLSIFYLLTIRYKIHATKFSTKVEPLLHITSIMVPLVTAITAASTGAIRSGPTICYLSWDQEHAVFLWLGLVVINACFFVCIYSMAAICYTVVRQNNRMRRYSYSSARTASRDAETRDTVKQALLYVAAFFLSFVFPGIGWVTKSNSFSLEVLSKIFYPLQGFWNFLFYIRPGVKEVRRANADRSLIWVLKQVVFHSKDRMSRVQQSRHNRRRMSETIPASMSPESTREINTYLNTDEIQSTILNNVELNQQVISYSISGIEGNIPDEVNCPHNIEQVGIVVATSEETGDLAIDNRNLLSSRSPHSLGVQWDDFGVSDTLANDCDNVGNKSRSSITSENKFESGGIVNPPLQLETGGVRDDPPKRRVSLVNLATINSLYNLDYLDSDSTED